MMAHGGRAPTLAQIDRWHEAYHRAEYGWSSDDRWEGEPTFGEVREWFEEFAAQVLGLRDAMREPFAPGSAEVLAEGLEEFAEDAGGGTLLAAIGASLKWGLAGADPAELRRLEAEHVAREARLEQRRHAIEQRAATPEVQRQSALTLLDMLWSAWAARIAEGAPHLTAEERRQAVARFDAMLSGERQLEVCR